MERMRGTGRRVGRTGRGGEGKEERIILANVCYLTSKNWTIELHKNLIIYKRSQFLLRLWHADKSTNIVLRFQKYNYYTALHLGLPSHHVFEEYILEVLWKQEDRETVSSRDRPSALQIIKQGGLGINSDINRPVVWLPSYIRLPKKHMSQHPGCSVHSCLGSYVIDPPGYKCRSQHRCTTWKDKIINKFLHAPAWLTFWF